MKDFFAMMYVLHVCIMPTLHVCLVPVVLYSNYSKNRVSGVLRRFLRADYDFTTTEEKTCPNG